MRRTTRGRGARGFTEPYVEPFPGAEASGTKDDFFAGCQKLRNDGYRVRYEPPQTASGWLCCRIPGDA
jgi:hypothetical protein